MLRWYTALAAVRNGDPELVDDRLDRVEVVEGDVEGSRWLRMTRSSVRVVANGSAGTATVPLGPDDGDAQVVLTWDPATTRRVPGGVELGGHGVAVLRVP